MGASQTARDWHMVHGEDDGGVADNKGLAESEAYLVRGEDNGGVADGEGDVAAEARRHLLVHQRDGALLRRPQLLQLLHQALPRQPACSSCSPAIADGATLSPEAVG